MVKKLNIKYFFIVILFISCNEKTNENAKRSFHGLVLNEICGDTGKEWVELYNRFDATIDLSGVKIILNGERVLYTVPENISISANSFKVFDRMQGTLTGTMPVDQPFVLSLVSPENETIDIFDRDREIGENKTHTVNTAYARIPDGTSFWEITRSPTKGYENKNSDTRTFDGLIINEICATTGEEWIELLNTSSSAMEIGGISIAYKNSQTETTLYQVPDNTIVNAKAYIVFDKSDGSLTGSFPMNKYLEISLVSPKNAKIYVFNRDKEVGVNEAHPQPGSYSRFPDGAATWIVTAIPTKNAKNKEGEFDADLIEYNDNTGNYNPNLFYRNDLSVSSSADPHCVYITEGAYAGNFFLYVTGMRAYRSIDLSRWEPMGTVFNPVPSSWGRTELWAPEVHYDKNEKTYYLFYSAHNSNQPQYFDCKHVGVATSKSPAGPFVQWTGVNANGHVITIGDPIIDIDKLDHSSPLYVARTAFIDVSPYIDPLTGDKYLYIVRTRHNAPTNEIWGMKMKDWVSPDYPTLTRLTTCNRTTVGGSVATDMTAGTIDEAPFMYYAHGKYYLTLSINETTEKKYSVVQAIGDAPLGPFTKVQKVDGGLVLGCAPNWDHAATTGHHCFIELGDELWAVYHQSTNRVTGGSPRGIAIDKVAWAQNSKGQYVIQPIGPTWSVQPLPAFVSGYRNIAPEATVSSNNTKAGSSATYLNDGLVRIHTDYEVVKEFEANAGKTTITLTFKDYVPVRAILVYNSCFYNKAYVQIDRIVFDYKPKTEPQTTSKAYIENLKFDFEKYANQTSRMMRSGAAAIAEFDEMPVREITLTVSASQGSDGFAISEIVVLGK